MIVDNTPEKSELRALFGAYLNADFMADYGSVDGAIAAYRRDTNAVHRAAALRELVRLRATTSSHAAFADALTGLGCEVAFAVPADAHALAGQLVEALREPGTGET